MGKSYTLQITVFGVESTNCIMTNTNKTELEEAFQLLDTNGDGMVSRRELKKLIVKFGGEISREEVNNLVKQADQDGDGKINFSEFSKLWLNIKKMSDVEEEQEIKEEFLRYDTDNNGFITKEEMLSVICGFSHLSGDKMLEAEKCVDDIDVDKDGKVSYPEFLLVWKYRL